MYIYHIVSRTIDSVCARHINYEDFRESNFTNASFVEPFNLESFELGQFYKVELGFATNYKISKIEVAEAPQRYLDELELLKGQLQIDDDPISKLKKDAEMLHHMKKKQNDFFKSKVAVFTWLYRKTLKEAKST